MQKTELMQAVRENPALAEEAQQRLAEVLSRSSTDADFRRQLLGDSRAALSSHFGREFPETVNIVFVENTADATIVLPDPVYAGAELSEAELEAVAGGIDPITAIALGSAIYLLVDHIW